VNTTTSSSEGGQIRAMPGADGGRDALATIVVPARFNGPPGGANGGWISGTLAGYLDDTDADATAGATTAEAVLRALTPLETPLDVVAADDGGVLLVRAGTVLVQAHAATVTGNGAPPPFVGLDEAARAGAGRAAAPDHPFPDCFGCGIGRAVGDGLRIRPGQVAGGPLGLVATTWTVDHGLADADGTVGRQLLWAALDCPSFWAHRAAQPAEDLAALLARQTVSLPAGSVITAGETYVAVASADAIDGRKLRASSALYTTDGALVASSTSLWIRVDWVRPAAS